MQWKVSNQDKISFFIKFPSCVCFFSFSLSLLSQYKRTILIKIPVIPLFLITTCTFPYAKYFVPLCENIFLSDFCLHNSKGWNTTARQGNNYAHLLQK